MLIINADCRHYKGEKPCVHERLCEGCSRYEPWNGQVLIIKTGAMGDVMRTTSILPALSREYSGFKIVWVASSASAPLVRNNPFIHEVLEVDSGVLTALMAREFDLIISLDKTPVESGLAEILKSKAKVGVGLSPFGTPYPLNPEAEYYFEMGLSDELKFKKNSKTYHELIREACRLEPGSEAPLLFLKETERNAAAGILAEAGLAASTKKLGIIPGAGKTYANKTPSAAWWRDFIQMCGRLSGREGRPDVVLLGGPADMPRIDAVREICGDLPYFAPEDVRVFAAVIEKMSAIVCGDTLALHIATALGVPLVALFGPTCPAEIEIFGRGEKIVSPSGCVPCYKGECFESPSCMDTIDVERVAQWALSII